MQCRHFHKTKTSRQVENVAFVAIVDFQVRWVFCDEVVRVSRWRGVSAQCSSAWIGPAMCADDHPEGHEGALDVSGASSVGGLPQCVTGALAIHALLDAGRVSDCPAA